ncbi:MAG: hypothetical protein DMD74_01215 [Gemmatimonadetes bacterium]|nr:MAG: hypothetical protein DMD74_01215 [Gemmatimonadota bacterium]
MSRAGRLAALAAVVLVASAHIGSPDTYFEGSAGPYRLRVIVRSPGVVPGLAQITVRLLDEGRARTVSVLPVYWDPRTAAPPPPDTARIVSGDSSVYSAALWLMTGGSYSVQVTVAGPAGTGTAIVPVQAIATRRLELQKPLAVGLAAVGAWGSRDSSTTPWPPRPRCAWMVGERCCASASSIRRGASIA